MERQFNTDNIKHPKVLLSDTFLSHRKDDYLYSSSREIVTCNRLQVRRSIIRTRFQEISDDLVQERWLLTSRETINHLYSFSREIRRSCLGEMTVLTSRETISHLYSFSREIINLRSCSREMTVLTSTETIDHLYSPSRKIIMTSDHVQERW